MNQETSLATELLHELKASARRWFVVAIIELIVITVLIILLFVMPAEITEEYTYDQAIEEIEDSDIVQRIGNDYGNSETDSNP